MKKATIHIGLHKTGSTYIQSMAGLNQINLLRSGLYYRREMNYPANHEQAWRVLKGDLSGIQRLVEEAIMTGAKNLLVSSEDLEALLLRPERAAPLVRLLLDSGYDRVEFAIYIRNPAERFWAIYSEISKHIYVDPIQMFCDVMRLGYYYVESPVSIHVKASFWCFSFDHFTNISHFDNVLQRDLAPGVCALRLYDFHSADTYLGQRFFADLGASEAIQRMPGKAAINARLTNGHVQSNYLGLVRTHLTTLSADKLSETLIQRTSFTTEQRAHIAVAIESRFLQGSRRVLRRYGQASEADWPRMAGSRS